MNNFFNAKYAVLTLGFWIVLFSGSAGFAQARNEVLIVADRKADCPGAAAMKCLQVKRPQDEKWTLFYQNIENFNHAEGYTYIVRVRVNTVNNPPADDSNLRYGLRAILHGEKTASEHPAGNTRNDDSALSANSWKLIKIDGAAIDAPKASISFNLDKNTVGGNGGCNGFGGDLEKNGNHIKINQIISTKMYCEAASDVENKFFGKLDQVTKYRINGGKMLLIAGENVVLEFAPKS